MDILFLILAGLFLLIALNNYAPIKYLLSLEKGTFTADSQLLFLAISILPSGWDSLSRFNRHKLINSCYTKAPFYFRTEKKLILIHPEHINLDIGQRIIGFYPKSEIKNTEYFLEKARFQEPQACAQVKAAMKSAHMINRSWRTFTLELNELQNLLTRVEWCIYKDDKGYYDKKNNTLYDKNMWLSKLIPLVGWFLGFGSIALVCLIVGIW